MKKVAVVLLIVLLGVFLLNGLRTVVVEVTVATMVEHFNKQFARLTDLRLFVG